MAGKFSHEKLHVYQGALDFTAVVEELVGKWPQGHAFIDHLIRASESIALNLASGCRMRGPREKARYADHALGSILECAACLDIAHVKKLLEHERRNQEKRGLLDMFRMTFSLRKAWETPSNKVREQEETYRTDEGSVIFSHEELNAYQKALEFMHWFVTLEEKRSIDSRLSGKLDKDATSVILNIAEGNGRYSTKDRKTFLRTAEKAAVKCAARLDVAVRRGKLDEREVKRGKRHLLSTTNLLIALTDSI